MSLRISHISSSLKTTLQTSSLFFVTPIVNRMGLTQGIADTITPLSLLSLSQNFTHYN